MSLVTLLSDITIGIFTKKLLLIEVTACKFSSQLIPLQFYGRENCTLTTSSLLFETSTGRAKTNTEHHFQTGHHLRVPTEARQTDRSLRNYPPIKTPHIYKPEEPNDRSVLKEQARLSISSGCLTMWCLDFLWIPSLPVVRLQYFSPFKVGNWTKNDKDTKEDKTN